MDGVIPFEDFEIEKNTTAIVFAPNPSIPILACLTYDSVSIRDSLSYSLKQIMEIKRTKESLHEFGPNSWIQWFNQENIAFGTSSGIIFTVKIKNALEPSKIQEANISRIISSTFVGFNHVGLCTTKSEIFFISTDGSVKYYMKISDDPTIIQCASFSPPSTLSCIIDGKPSFLSLDFASFQKNFKPLIKQIPLNNVRLVSYSPRKNLLCVENEDSSVILINCSTKKIAPFEVCKPAQNNPIVFMEWVINRNYLILINEEGQIITYYDNNSTYKVTNLNAKKGFSFCYEPFTNRLIYKDQESIRFVGFVQVKSHFIFSSHQVFDAVFSKTIFNSTGTFYPITNISHNSDLGITAIATPNKFLIIYKDGKTSIIKEIQIQNICVLDEFVAVFSKDNDKTLLTMFDVYNLDIMLTSDFPYFPDTISVYDNQMITSNCYHYSIVKLIQEELQEDLIKCGKYYIAFNHKRSYEKIRNAFLFDKDSPVLYCDNGNVFCIELDQNFCNDVKYAFQIDSPPFIFMKS